MKYFLVFTMLILFSGCTFNITNDENGNELVKEYYVDVCHYISKDQNFSCTKDNTHMCDLGLAYTDICGKYVTCNDEGEIEKDEDMYNKCIDCFSGVAVNEVSAECSQMFSE